MITCENCLRSIDELIEVRPDETIVLDLIEFRRPAMFRCKDDQPLSIAFGLLETSQVVANLLEVDAVGDRLGLEPQRRRALNRGIRN